MLSRPSPECPIKSPLVNSPYVIEKDLSLGSFPINNDWMLLDTDHFTLLAGDNWSFLGSF